MAPSLFGAAGPHSFSDANLLDEPHVNEVARSIEFSLRDPDGYAMTVSQWTG